MLPPPAAVDDLPLPMKAPICRYHGLYRRWVSLRFPPAHDACVMTLFCRTLALLTGLALSLHGHAQSVMTRNEASLSRFAPLPVVGEGALLAAGRNHWALTADLTNEFYTDTVGTETVLLDGETLNTTLRWRRGLGDGWAVGADLSLLNSGGGLLDNWIENWHEWFGLPNGQREQFEQDRYRFALTHNGDTRFARNRGVTEPGDVRLRLSRSMVGARQVHAQLSVPTGRADALTGGSWGGALWLEESWRFGDGRWGGFVSGGGTLQETRGMLADLQRPVTGFASGGLDWNLWRDLSLLGQLYAHTALYEDVASDIGDPGLQLALAARWRFSPEWSADLAFQEDLIVNASPDFSLHLGIRFHPGG